MVGEKLLLTGLPGMGKTTLVRKVLDVLGERALGFYTQEIRERGKRKGFRLITTWGEEGLLAHEGLDSPFRVSRYSVSLDFLEEVIGGIQGRWRPGRILVVDEVGKMELFSQVFRDWIEKAALDPGVPFLATIALKSRDPLVVRLKKKLSLWEVALANRDTLLQEITRVFGF